MTKASAKKSTGKAADQRELLGVRMAEWWLWAVVFLAGIWATGKQQYGFGQTLALFMDETLRIILYKCCVMGLAAVIAYRVDIKLMYHYRGEQRQKWLRETASVCGVGKGESLFAAHVALFGVAMICRALLAWAVFASFSQAL